MQVITIRLCYICLLGTIIIGKCVICVVIIWGILKMSIICISCHFNHSLICSVLSTMGPQPSHFGAENSFPQHNIKAFLDPITTYSRSKETKSIYSSTECKGHLPDCKYIAQIYPITWCDMKIGEGRNFLLLLW